VLGGLLLGILINYLSDVLPASRRPAPDCEGAYTLKDYLLDWRCADCGRRHPTRHGVVLAVCALVGALLAWFTPRGLFWPAWLPLLVFLGVIFVVDLEHRLVLFETSLFGLVICFVYGWVLHGFTTTLLGGLGGLGIMLAFFILGPCSQELSARCAGARWVRSPLGLGMCLRAPFWVC
jgi:hypothetical protein